MLAGAAEMDELVAEMLARPKPAPLGSPANPIIVPPAVYAAIKADPRFADVVVVKNGPLNPFCAVVICE